MLPWTTLWKSIDFEPLRQPLLLQSRRVLHLPPTMLFFSRSFQPQPQDWLNPWYAADGPTPLRISVSCGSLETYQRDCLQFLLLCSNGNSFNTIQTWILRIVLFTYQLTVYLITLPHPHPHMCADVCATYYKCIASCTYKSIGAPCYLSIA